MTNYPNSLDNDRTILRIDDNLSELGSSAINQLREAVFSIEKTLGINPQGSKSSVNERISVSLNPDGHIKAEALQSLGVATLPISDNQIANNAGIKESKLQLNHNTNDLYTTLLSLASQLNLVQGLLSEGNTDFLTHVSGGVWLSDGITKARHAASHIDLNAVPTDSRDTYTWTGLLDVHGDLRPATHVASALLEINNELVTHENAVTNLVHPASAISVDTSNFTELPASIENVQEVFGYIDNKETLSTGIDRATLNSNGIPRTARIQNLARDGYTVNVVPVTRIHAFLSEPSGLAPLDSINNGDDVIRFLPDNTDFAFDARFTNVKVGDILRINYGNGLEAMFPIMAVRFSAGTEWSVRVNSKNLFDATDGYEAYARIDRPNFDRNTWGVLAVAGACPNIVSSNSSVHSAIVGNPHGAVALGLGFDPNKINNTHYKLYLRLYPTGNPEIFTELPAIDVSGNAGTTPGHYNLDMIVENVNKQFRTSGYNYRFIAFAHKGEFGLLLADSCNGVAFSIISSQINSNTGNIEQGPFTLNVIGDATDGLDALGFGYSRAGFASPSMTRTGGPAPYPSSIAAANYATLIIYPVSNRNALVNGNRRDVVATPRFVEGDGYWRAVVSSVTVDSPNQTNHVTYSISMDLASEGLSPGKTIVVQPIDPNNTVIKDYGRFIIEDVSYSCGGAGQTNITVLNAIHGTGVSNNIPAAVGTQVLIYFSDDSVMFNLGNMLGADGLNDPNDYHHYHEVFINNIGKTVSVERARMPRTDSGTTPVPGTGNIGSLPGWRIRKVSPKFKGYRTGTTEFRHFVYLSIANYDDVSGEFEAYLSTLSIPRFSGPIARGKKNHAVRIYDQSYVNFIEIEYREDVANPGAAIPLGLIAIELFPTPIDNEEYMPLAGVSHAGVSFGSVTDLREFGTISEKNFTDSAMRFIEAGERYLHANGVVRGFSYAPYPNTSNPYLLPFTGGLALVNGSFVAVDNTTVNVPILYGSNFGTDGGPIPDVIEHFICVNSTGQLVSIVKSNGAAYFDSTTGTFVESLTFREIVDNRKDLTVIAKATVTISTNSVMVTDARRHVTNESVNNYSWAFADYVDNSNPYNASFISPDALMIWVNEYNVREVEVKTVTIGGKTVLNFTNKVTLKGGTYNITSAQGLAFESGNWKIDGAQINYNPTNITYDTGDIFNVKNNWGAILIDLASIFQSDINNFGIENSFFNSNSPQRPPFVGFYSAIGTGYNLFGNGRFINNTFTDSSATMALCYAFINSNSPDISTASPYFADMLISGTKINGRQGLLITGRAIPDTGEGRIGYLASNPVFIENFTIKDNRFGLIGFNVNQWIYQTEAARFIVENNKCEMISSGITATMHPRTLTHGEHTRSTPGNSVSNRIINNDCYYMKIEASAGAYLLKTLISGNNIKRWDDIMHNAVMPDPVPWAMYVTSTGQYPTNVTISDNSIDGLDGSNGYGYLHGIYVSGSAATITGNTVLNIAGSDNPDARGLGISNDGTEQQSVIVGNTLMKQDGVHIGGFIYSFARAAIYGNNLSHFDMNFWSGGPVDGYGDSTNSDFAGITGPGSYFAAWNSNQVVRFVPNLASAIPLFHITPESGDVVTVSENDEKLLFGANFGSPVSTPAGINLGLKKVTYNENRGWSWQWENYGTPFLNNNDGTVGLMIPVSSVLPDRAYLLSLSIDVEFNCPWGIYRNNSTQAPTTFPQVVLELNGNIVAWASLDTFSSSVTLTYQSNALQTGERPVAPLIKEIAVRLRQGVEGVTNPKFGGWVGPLGVSSVIPAVLIIRQPWISYLY